MDGIEEATGELIAGLKAVSNILNKPKKKILQENMDKKSIYGSMMSINKAGQEQRQAMRHNRQARASVRQRIASNLTRETSKCQDKPNGQPIRKRSVSGAEDDPLKIDMVVADDVISMKERVSCNLIYSKMEPSRPKKRNRKSPSEPWRSENAQKTSLQPSTSRLKNTGRSTTLERSLWSLKILWKHVLDRQTSSQQFI